MEHPDHQSNTSIPTMDHPHHQSTTSIPTMDHPHHQPHQPHQAHQTAPHTPYGPNSAHYFEDLNQALFQLPTQPAPAPGHANTPDSVRATRAELASERQNIFLRPCSELPSEQDVYLNLDDLMEGVHAYAVRTGCDLVRHAQKVTAKGEPPFRWMMLCSRAGNPPATTPTIRTNTRSKKCQCPFGFWCIALDRQNPLTSQYRIKLSESHSQHNHAPATFAELPNAKRRARRAGEIVPRTKARPRQLTQTGGRPSKLELQMDFRICVQLNPIIPMGEGPWGKRSIVNIKSGQWSATWGAGTVEVSSHLSKIVCRILVLISLILAQPGGQDSLLVRPESLHTFVETKYLLRTADEPPAFIAVETSGWRTGPREVMERLQDPERAEGVDPSEYSFKTSIKLETGDERYKDRLNGGLWIGSGARTGDEGGLNVLRREDSLC
jgi:hypothetical protein